MASSSSAFYAWPICGVMIKRLVFLVCVMIAIYLAAIALLPIHAGTKTAISQHVANTRSVNSPERLVDIKGEVTTDGVHAAQNLSIVGVHQGNEVVWTAWLDDGGHFELMNVQLGVYDVYFIDGLAYKPIGKVRITADLTKLALCVPRGVVEGHVRDRSGRIVAGAKLKLTGPSSGFTYCTTTDSSGHYRIEHMQEGSYDAVLTFGSIFAERQNLTINVTKVSLNTIILADR